MKIAIDFDGVLFDNMPSWLAEYNKVYGDNLTPEDITDWEIWNFVKCSKQEIFRCRDQIYNEHLPLIPGAYSFVNYFHSLGNELIVITTDSKGFVDRKLGLLDLHFPGKFSDVIFTRNKQEQDYDFLIDDYWGNLDTRGILFSQPWNRHCGWNGMRAEGWEDVADLLLSI